MSASQMLFTAMFCSAMHSGTVAQEGEFLQRLQRPRYNILYSPLLKETYKTQ